MKKAFVLFFCIAFARVAGFGQYATGLVFNDEGYESSPRLALGGKATASLPQVSLKQFTPYPADQRNCGSCVGWASGYACLSTSWAIKYNLTDRDEITRRANSPMYIYCQISQDCQHGSRVEDALAVIKNGGDCLKTDFNPAYFQEIEGGMLQVLRSKAYPYRIKDFAAVFGLNADAQTKIAETKMSLQNNQPVLVGAVVYPSIKRVNRFNPLWAPDPGNEEVMGGHAMCVIGYNDYTRTFEIMNSWGRDWGNDGYFNISYADYAKVVKYAFQITLDDRKKADDPVTVSGDFVLEKFYKWDDDQKKPLFNEVFPQLTGREYTLSGSDIKKDDYYRLIAKNVKKDCYIYVFSIDPNNKAEVLFPFGKSQFASEYSLNATVVEVPRVYANSIVEIPGNNKVIKTDVQGEDHLCILYAFNQIPNIEQVVQSIRNSGKMTFREKLRDVLGSRLMPESSLVYKSGMMSVSGASATGDIVPIILKMNVQ
ncbi:MAG: C1 family peptidase [Puia sp.]|nr:C1 family peptidase [Puia sp.]